MRTLLFLVILSGNAFAQFQPKCQAPGQSFLEGKLKESFATFPAEQELKDLVKDPKNYNLREEVKALDRRSKVATRLSMKEISEDMQQKFTQMIETSNRVDEIADFPVPGAIGKINAESDSIAIELSNLSKEGLDVIPKPVLDKLSNKVKIKYHYPYDKFEYFLTYEGRELPAEKALSKLQFDFEDACEERLRDNQHAKDLNDLDRKSRGLGPITNPSAGSTGKANSQ